MPTSVPVPPAAALPATLSEISSEHAQALARQYWSWECSASPLPSYADRNFLLQDQAHPQQARHVLKIANPGLDLAEIALENAAFQHLAKRCPDLNLPRLILSRDGRDLIPLRLADGRLCQMRILSFVEGKTYADQLPAIPVPRDSLHFSLGAVLGQLGAGFSDFQHPAAKRELIWNLCSLPQLATEIAELEEVDLRQRVARHFDFFAAQLPHWQSSLPQAVIHNDANDYNVIVDAQQGCVTSIIDFGDLCTSLRIADLAIAAVYAMQHEDEPLRCLLQMLQGYHRHYPLLAEEIQALLPCICARLCHSILMANRSYRANPENDYILISQHGVRRLLARLDTCDQAAFVHHALSLLAL